MSKLNPKVQTPQITTKDNACWAIAVEYFSHEEKAAEKTSAVPGLVVGPDSRAKVPEPLSLNTLETGRSQQVRFKGNRLVSGIAGLFIMAAFLSVCIQSTQGRRQSSVRVEKTEKIWIEEIDRTLNNRDADASLALMERAGASGNVNPALLRPRRAFALYLKALGHAKDGDPEQALAMLDRIDVRYASLVAKTRRHAEAGIQLDQYNQAVAALKAANSPADFEKARHLLESLAPVTGSGRKNVALALATAETGLSRHEQALARLNPYIKNHPEDEMAQTLKGAVLYETLGPEQALEIWAGIDRDRRPALADLGVNLVALNTPSGKKTQAAVNLLNRHEAVFKAPEKQIPVLVGLSRLRNDIKAAASLLPLNVAIEGEFNDYFEIRGKKQSGQPQFVHERRIEGYFTVSNQNPFRPLSGGRISWQVGDSKITVPVTDPVPPGKKIRLGPFQSDIIPDKALNNDRKIRIAYAIAKENTEFDAHIITHQISAGPSPEMPRADQTPEIKLIKPCLQDQGRFIVSESENEVIILIEPQNAAIPTYEVNIGNTRIPENKLAVNKIHGTSVRLSFPLDLLPGETKTVTISATGSTGANSESFEIRREESKYRYMAVLFGNDNYDVCLDPETGEFSKLNGSRNRCTSPKFALPSFDTMIDHDLQGLSGVLESYGFEFWGWGEKNIKYKKNPSPKDLFDLNGSLHKTLSERARLGEKIFLLVYASGHGIPKKYDGVGPYYVPKVKPGDSAKEMIETTRLLNRLKKVAAHKVLLIADYCHSGLETKSAKHKGTQEREYTPRQMDEYRKISSFEWIAATKYSEHTAKGTETDGSNLTQAVVKFLEDHKKKTFTSSEMLNSLINTLNEVGYVPPENANYFVFGADRF